jgi:AcrR family transcriptional regulator
MNQPRTRDTDPGAVEGRARLLDAAERLFDAEGLDKPSARGIALEAGHRNTAAVWYHFGDRFGLIRALADRWASALEDRRQQLLDEVDAMAAPTARDYVAAMIRPWVETLDSFEWRRRVPGAHPQDPPIECSRAARKDPRWPTASSISPPPPSTRP